LFLLSYYSWLLLSSECWDWWDLWDNPCFFNCFGYLDDLHRFANFYEFSSVRPEFLSLFINHLFNLLLTMANIWVLSIYFNHCIGWLSLLLESQRAIRYSKLNDNSSKLASKVYSSQMKSIIWWILGLICWFLISHSSKLSKYLLIKSVKVYNLSIITKNFNYQLELGLFLLFDEYF